MANKDAAFGFRPVRHLSGGEIRTNEYSIAANYGTAIYHGQCVIAVTAGGVEAAAAGNVVLGVSTQEIHIQPYLSVGITPNAGIRTACIPLS